MFTVIQIEQQHAKVKTGADFPNYIREIKQLGVVAFETWVKDGRTIYFGTDDFQKTSDPQYAELNIADNSDKKQFIKYLEMHQQGHTEYIQFCRECAKTGIEKWFISLDEMTCIYYDKAGKIILSEKIPG